jgi:N-acetylmuramoyl-L-alanine amidase
VKRIAIALALAALAVLARTATADPGTSIQLKGLRSWSSPQNTRVVFDLSEVVAYVSPDSGTSASLVISIPGSTLRAADGVPAAIGVHDSVVDSVWVDTPEGGAQIHVAFSASTQFQVFALAGDEDKPYRIVVDVTRPGGGAQVEQRLQRIARLKQDRKRVVAVDAGHGGEDTGARGPYGVLEKSVTLAVARALVKELNQIPGVQGALTRDGDYFIPLQSRYRMAEKMKADVFISIHANSSRRRSRNNRGSEVYFLSLRGASDQFANDLADVENAADLVGGVPAHAEDDLVSILYDVKRSSQLQSSQVLAESILDGIAVDRRLESRGVKQAAFVVLKSVEFPSVLVEMAFINNPTEARLLRDPKFQKQMAEEIAVGVKAYLSRVGVGFGRGLTGNEGSSGAH